MGAKASLKYATVVARHKWFVFVAGLRLRVPLRQLIVHDWTKLTPAEWGPYTRRFGSGRSGALDKSTDPDDFQRAWTHHWHRNPHHWEHWIALEGNGGVRPLKMPERYVREMVADWFGAGRAYTGSWDIRPWYGKNRDRIVLHPETRVLVEALIP